MILHQRTAVLQQLHRALLTAPEAVPDTYFAFVVNDNMKNNSWSFARPNKESTYNTWLIPSFAFWSWPASNLGTMDDVLHRIITLESTAPFREKVDKVVWRGTPWFNPVGHAHLRQSLLGATKDKDWADVQALNVSKNGEESTNGLKIEEFCRYKYVVYTEGVTYSGRLPFHQACESVLLTAPLTYLTTTAWMMKPIDAEELMSQYSYEDDSSSPSSKTTSTSPSHFTPLLPLVSDYRLANAIYVTPDFSNLERTIDFLHQHPEVARRIARNQRDVVAQKGYLSPAAEACYWRSLVGGWAASAVPDNNWGEEKGERFESWILKEVEGRSRGRGRQGSQNGPGIG